MPILNVALEIILILHAVSETKKLADEEIIAYFIEFICKT